MVNKKIRLTGILIIVLTIMSIYLVSALGVGAPYSDDNPLEMYAGETKIVQLSLQNSDIERGVTLKGILLEGVDIASLDEGPHDISQDGEVFSDLDITIPVDASIGDKYLIRYEFIEEAAQGEGMISFGRKVGSGFKISVIEKPAETPAPEGISTTWWTLGIVLVVIIIAVIWFMKKNKKEENSISVK